MTEMTINDHAQIVLDEMGILLNSKPISSNTARASYLKQRLKDYSSEQLIAFVNWQFKQWENWELRNQYFRPETLFQKKRVSECMEKVELGDAPLDPEPTKETVDCKNISLEEYRTIVLRGSRYFGYHYRRMTDSKKKKVDQIIIKDYQSGKPVYSSIGIKTFEAIRKESHERPENQI